MRCFSGFSQGIFFPVPPTCIADVSPKEKLVDALGILGMASAFPAMLSPAMGLHLYETVSPSAFFAVAAGMTFVSVIFSLLYQDSYQPDAALAAPRRKFSLDTVLELSVLLPCLAFFCGSFGFSAVNNFVIIYGETLGISQIGLFFTIHNLAIVLSRLIAERSTPSISRRISCFGSPPAEAAWQIRPSCSFRMLARGWGPLPSASLPNTWAMPLPLCWPVCPPSSPFPLS